MDVVLEKEALHLLLNNIFSKSGYKYIKFLKDNILKYMNVSKIVKKTMKNSFNE